MIHQHVKAASSANYSCLFIGQHDARLGPALAFIHRPPDRSVRFANEPPQRLSASLTTSSRFDAARWARARRAAR